MHKKQITIVVGVITNDKGEVLLCKRNEPELVFAHGKWEFPGGGIEFGEDPIEAVKREVKEETGVDVEIVRMLPKVISDKQEYTAETSIHVIIISYECKIISGTPTAHLNEEVEEVKFFPKDEIKNLNTFRNTQPTIEMLNSNY